MTCNVLILGASYGSLLATKLLMAGHDVTLVCTAGTATLINREGTLLRFPPKGSEAALEIRSRDLPGRLSACTPDAAQTAGYDLAVLGMQESQYGGPSVRELMGRIARSRLPCLAIMNMPPLPYLARIPGLSTRTLRGSYTDPGLWDGFDPSMVTLASPDPQAFRPPEEAKNVLQVGLPTNFKAARFESERHTAMLRGIAADIEAARFDAGAGPVEVPVKLKVHDSVFVPLAKWPMLLAGNYRCILPQGMVPIRDAVHGDISESAAVYEWVVQLCQRLGAAPEDLVPFQKYAAAAAGLGKPSSAARALFGGAVQIERVDSLVRDLGEQYGMRCEALDQTVALVDARLGINRAQRSSQEMPERLVRAA